MAAGPVRKCEVHGVIRQVGGSAQGRGFQLDCRSGRASFRAILSPMKTILAVFAAGVFFADTASAIPQTFNNGFLGAVGMSFEQYVSSPAPWTPGEELKGPWQSERKGGVELLGLGVDATVFGIPAAQISAERVEGAVRSVTVRFDGKKMKAAKANPGALYAQLLTNITALAGEPKSVSPSGAKIFRYESSFVTVRKPAGGEVFVDFTPAK